MDPHPELQAAALLALMQVMAVEARVCEANLPLVFTLLKYRCATLRILCATIMLCTLLTLHPSHCSVADSPRWGTGRSAEPAGRVSLGSSASASR